MKDQFQKGQEVQVRGPDDWENAIYIAYMGDVIQTDSPHVVLVGGSTWQARGYALCRPRRPNLKVDAPVWVICAGGEIQPANFAGWSNDFMLVWAFGRNSHTACNEGDVIPFGPGRYRTTPPEEE